MLGIFGGLLAQNNSDTNAVLEKEKPLEIEFAPAGGFYEEEIIIDLFAPGTTIYYTTDGSQPEFTSSDLYEGPIIVDATTVIRAIAQVGDKTSNIFSHTYFIQEPETNIPVISISVNSKMLFDPVHGMFMKGTNAIDTLWKLPGANFWSRNEIPLNVELFEADGKCVYRSLSGFRLFGGMSRLFPQKSMAIVARKRYGQKRIKHRIFGDGGLKKFKFLVLRNSGSDFGKTHFRDALMTSLLDDWDIEKQDYRASHLYINGDYWGIYNIREKVNRYFLADHHGIDEDSIDLIEHRYSRKTGSKYHYLKMLNFLRTNELSDRTNYAVLQSMMEVENFMDYQIAQIYFDNQDAGGNIKFWRPQTPEGKWRWIMYDTDWGFGLHDAEAYKNNSIAFHTEANGPSWPNPPWSTLILRKLLENEDFKDQFITKFADYLNTTFESVTVEKKIDEIHHTLIPEIPRHQERWKLRPGRWDNQVKIMRQFARNRPEYIRMYLMEMFNTGSLRDLELTASGGGQILLNQNIEIEDYFKGKYFEKLPVKIKAIPQLGYRFSHWEGIDVAEGEKDLTLELSQKRYQIKAVFEPFEHPLAGKIIINEISCNNRETEDWIEIYNYSDEKVNLKDWIFTDANNEFRFPETILPAKEYLVLCENEASFVKTFPDSYRLVGDLGFGLNKVKENLKLFSPEGATVDAMSYEIEPSDSIATLNLLLPWLTTNDFENWEIRKGIGTPNFANPYYVESTIQAQRDLWMQIGGAAAVILICLMLLFLRGTGRV